MTKVVENQKGGGVQGTPFTPENQDPDFGEPAGKETESGIELVAETPEWVQRILDSNNAVIKSNNEVVAAIEQFNEGATDIVSRIVESSVVSKSAPKEAAVSATPLVEAAEIKINKKARYVVAKGKRFSDGKAGGVVREAGYDVSEIDSDRLKRLIQIGVVTEEK